MHGVCFESFCQVETIGDAYMVVGGVPQRSESHALEVAEMAFDMLRCTKTQRNPSDVAGKSHVQLRIGEQNLN